MEHLQPGADQGTRRRGEQAGDWSITAIVGVFATAIVFLGLSTAVAGKWLEDVGPRCAGVCAAGLWGAGLVLGGVGIELHQLWLQLWLL